MEDFSTFQGALEIFQKVNCVGQVENCIIGAIVDSSKSTKFTASMIGYGAFGAAGYVAGSAIGQERDLRIRDINGYIFVLLNFTEYGVGIMPLRGMCMKINPEKLDPVYNEFAFCSYQELSGISVKNFYGIRKSVKTIKITFANKNKLYFTANMVEKALLYQENCMNRFVGRYQK